MPQPPRQSQDADIAETYSGLTAAERQAEIMERNLALLEGRLDEILGELEGFENAGGEAAAEEEKKEEAQTNGEKSKQ